MSTECRPNPTQNITGLGFKVDYLPGGTAMQTMSSSVACTETGFELYDCLCAPQKPGQNAGQATKPNLCAMACNAAGPEFGQGCANGDPNDPSFADSGDGTRCAAGANVGRLRDEDADCPRSTCSAHPLHCQGDPTFDRSPCPRNGDRGLGSCVDACPGGRCVPLCVVDTAETKVPGRDGVCAAGPPLRHCEGAGFEFLLCTKDALNGSCKAVCTQAPGTSCTTQSDCPSAVCNAGVCEFPVISCTTDADCPTEGPGLGCNTGTGTCVVPVGLECASDGDCPACYGSCDHAEACEANSDGIIGTTDDFVGAGVCVSDNKNNCHLEPIVAVGKTTADSGFDVTTDDIHGVLWCYGSTQSPAINAGGGFGGIGRVIQHGQNLTNGFTSLP